ncbi:type II secretion system major pseudopilin GspG [Pseudorhodoferax sp.]|uniref:type II secretion system major pseudopilin GspG n=1 Tax=Pseudorhodoferax sp. TaxID=1993553 RepID=UPI002DD6B5D1|nr:type II secretion system major pseudopilin GspG [Pseudorhodoferax sp.]
MISLSKPRSLRAPIARARRHRGFTLIELMVVLAILALLAGLVGPRVLNQLGGAKAKTTAVQIADLDKSLELFKLDVGRYPTTEEGLQALVARPGALGGWSGPYLKGNVPADAWGNPFRYTSTGGSVEILSLGADNAPGGEGEAADIRNTP